MRKNTLENIRLAYISRQKNMDVELRQAKEEGHDIEKYYVAAEQIMKAEPGQETESRALSLCEEIRKSPLLPDYPYHEPNSMDEIFATLPTEMTSNAIPLSYSKIYGALMGRICGCLLGQPVEGWTRERICGLLKVTDNYPLKQYISSALPDEIRKQFSVEDIPGSYGNPKKSWINNVECAPEDDDLNYTLLSLEIMEQYGMQFTAEDVCEALTLNIPVFLTCTAERIAYKNIVNGILPPETAAYGNPYREWLGGQIRVDGYAYAYAGFPTKAAERAAVDASVTHTKNGIYASMFCAALISLCAIETDMRVAVNRAIQYIPKTCRLYQALAEFLRLERTGITDSGLIDFIHNNYNESDKYDWCYVVPNDMIILLALLRGGEDYSRVIGLAVEAGFDTDCNAATAGSAFGMMYGVDAIDTKWIEPLNGEIISRIGACGRVKIDDLANRFFRLAESVQKEWGNELCPKC